MLAPAVGLRHSITGRFVARLCPQFSVMAANKINFNTKHLKKGDPLPPYSGTLRVYNMRYCPFAQRTILALRAKEIPCEVINVNLVQKPEWLPKVSPFGKVPSIEIAEGKTVYESLVTVEYLDEVYPQRPLLPKDPYLKAMDRIIVEAGTPIHTMMFKIIRSPENITEENIASFHNALEFIQDQLKIRGTPFLDGTAPGYADYMIWPWLERLQAIKHTDKTADIDIPKFKLLSAYVQRMLKDPVVAEYLIPHDIFNKFFESYKAGNPDYSMLDEQ